MIHASRRAILFGGLAALLMPPAIVRAESLMGLKLRPLRPPGAPPLHTFAEVWPEMDWCEFGSISIFYDPDGVLRFHWSELPLRNLEHNVSTDEWRLVDAPARS